MTRWVWAAGQLFSRTSRAENGSAASGESSWNCSNRCKSSTWFVFIRSSAQWKADKTVRRCELQLPGPFRGDCYERVTSWGTGFFVTGQGVRVGLHSGHSFVQGCTHVVRGGRHESKNQELAEQPKLFPGGMSVITVNDVRAARRARWRAAAKRWQTRTAYRDECGRKIAAVGAGAADSTERQQKFAQREAIRDLATKRLRDGTLPRALERMIGPTLDMAAA